MYTRNDKVRSGITVKNYQESLCHEWWGVYPLLLLNAGRRGCATDFRSGLGSFVSSQIILCSFSGQTSSNCIDKELLPKGSDQEHQYWIESRRYPLTVRSTYVLDTTKSDNYYRCTCAVSCHVATVYRVIHNCNYFPNHVNWAVFKEHLQRLRRLRCNNK